ncbi:MAG: VWA domain-containing protein, partial [Pseudomonadota bacterium]|nr:VWA domain-containing protein [Pseudomonadota bacterium]
MKSRSTIWGFCIAVLVMICGADSVVRADDTEIYFGAGFGNNTIKPNILMVLDTSDSMKQQVEGTGKSRLRNMQDAMNQLIGTLDNVNIGLMRFNGVYRDEKDADGFEYVATGGPILFPVADLDAPAADFFGEPDDSNQFITARIA